MGNIEQKEPSKGAPKRAQISGYWGELAQRAVESGINNCPDTEVLYELGVLATRNQGEHEVPFSEELIAISDLFAEQRNYDLSMQFREAAYGRESLPYRQAS